MNPLNFLSQSKRQLRQTNKSGGFSIFIYGGSAPDERATDLHPVHYRGFDSLLPLYVCQRRQMGNPYFCKFLHESSILPLAITKSIRKIKDHRHWASKGFHGHGLYSCPSFSHNLSTFPQFVKRKIIKNDTQLLQEWIKMQE